MRMASSPICRIAPILLFCAGLLAALAPPLGAQDEPPSIPLPVFEFHSGFWLNLHHTLYHQARLQRNTGSPASVLTNLNTTEQKAWDAAVAYYSQAYAGKDLLFSLDLVLIKNQ